MQTEVARLKQENPDMPHKDRCGALCASGPSRELTGGGCAGSSWSSTTGTSRRRRPSEGLRRRRSLRAQRWALTPGPGRRCLASGDLFRPRSPISYVPSGASFAHSSLLSVASLPSRLLPLALPLSSFLFLSLFLLPPPSSLTSTRCISCAADAMNARSTA